MDMDERHRQIVQMVRAQKSVKVMSLSKFFQVSPETIRKDLVELDEQGHLVRVHGGARFKPAERESAYERRQAVNQAAKHAIAVAALSAIEEGSAIYLDYGTTTYAIAAELVKAQRRVTVLTNALPIATLLATSDTVDGVVLGGMLRRNEGSLYGPFGERALESVYIDHGFFGCGGIHADAGVTNHFPLEVAMSQKAMSRCNTITVVADEDKLDAIAVNKLAELAQLDLLITNTNPSIGLQQALDDADVTVMVTQEGATDEVP